MNQPEPTQENPESKSLPTGGLGHFPEPYFFLTDRRILADGTQVEEDEPGFYCRYPLRSWEAAGILEWYEYAMWIQGDFCPVVFESSQDAATGLRTLTTTDKETGETRAFFPRPAGTGRPCGLYTFSGHIANWIENQGRDIENLAEFVSVQAANGRPMTIFEASTEMDRLCAAMAGDGKAFQRQWINMQDGKPTPTACLEEVNAEVMTARYSDFTNLVIGYGPIEKKAPAPLKEERG